MSLFLVFLIGMIGRAVIMLGPGALAVSESSITRAQAQRAAESGLEYAASKLRGDPNWRGTENRVTVDTPGLTVVEDQGNVIGLISDEQGHVSQFRMRFNYQDGDPGADGLTDPGRENKINLRFISLNNLRGTKETPIPVADPGSFQVTKPDEGQRALSQGAAYLVVEGRAGRGLNQNLDGRPNAPVHGEVSRYVAEAYLEATLNEPGDKASMMGGGNIAFKVGPKGKVTVSNRDVGASDVVTRLRSKGSVSVDENGQPGVLQMVQGEVGRDENKPPGFSARASGVTLKQESVGDGKDFFNLKWDAVTKAGSDPARGEPVHIPGGTYVHWDNGTTHYYDMDLTDYKGYMGVAANQTDPGVVLSDNLSEIRDSSNVGATRGGLSVRSFWNPLTRSFSTTWQVNKDLLVQPSGHGVESMAVIPRSGASASPADTTDLIALSKADSYSNKRIKFNMNQSIVSANGDLALYTQLRGLDSTLTSAGNIKIITTKADMEDSSSDEVGSADPSSSEVVQKLRLNMYAKNDIAISSYNMKSFKALKLEGLIYSWGNFTATLGDVSLAKNDWADFTLNGAVVAYGANPTSGTPGAAGTGRIDVTAQSAEIIWDDRKVTSLVTPSVVNLRRSVYSHKE